MEYQKGKYNPLPKLPREKGVRKNPEIDREKIRDMYVNGKDYKWADFVSAHNFHPRCKDNIWRKNSSELNEWKLEWQRQQLKDHDEDLTPQIFATQKAVTLARINFVGDWIKRTKYLKAMYDAVLAGKSQDLREDLANPLVQSGALPRKFKMEFDELNTLAGAAMRIQELEQRAMLIVMPPEKMLELEKQIEEENDMPEIEVAEIGAIMSGEESVARLASYFDQFEKKIELPPPEIKVNEENKV